MCQLIDLVFESFIHSSYFDLIFTVSYPSINWQGQFLRVLAISSNYRNCTSQPYVIVFIVCFNVHDPNYSNLYGITDYTPLSQLDSNRLSGTIPDSLGNLERLDYLYVWHWYSRLSFCFVLTRSVDDGLNSFLDTNQLIGAIPESLGNLDQLDYLYVWRRYSCRSFRFVLTFCWWSIE